MKTVVAAVVRSMSASSEAQSVRMPASVAAAANVGGRSTRGD